ncbi:type II toxin-antitoxin system RelE/ParE family toxin [Mucilaginibacter roseus]|uniref:Type II toxin-antitoxin system RelE/ParE family toxin n=1 Tax=Mucilaginibacter roseus TaxID=1528868 RepID=A0ABS8U407_9SPHI|nr:type II toxin-antitoxin system RelE/ParE family toxin [Mucilaginibacter roseus]MCD8741853.1 type II toxin-antitoxin system RelE/ParE family toxin [Mucilaginibacter roseus]
MYKTLILPSAKNDIEEATIWYNKKQKGLGVKFTSYVRQKIALIKQEPFIASTRYDNVKTAVLDTFPFMIHYLLNENEKVIIIIAVFHTSRDPKIWKRDSQ